MNKLATQLNDTLGAAADFLSAAGKRMDMRILSMVRTIYTSVHTVI